MEYRHPEAVAPHPGRAFTSYVYSSRRRRGTAVPTSALLLARLLKLVQLVERQSPRVSPAASPWARFLPLQLYYYWWLCLPSKSKKAPLNQLVVPLKPKSCTHNETCTGLSRSQSWRERSQMVDIKMSPGGAVPEPFFRGPFVPSQPAHFFTYLPEVPLIPL